jgi:hypothetical protein
MQCNALASFSARQFFSNLGRPDQIKATRDNSCFDTLRKSRWLFGLVSPTNQHNIGTVNVVSPLFYSFPQLSGRSLLFRNEASYSIRNLVDRIWRRNSEKQRSSLNEYRTASIRCSRRPLWFKHSRQLVCVWVTIKLIVYE